MNMITTAASQYANRPKDESYPDLTSMIQAAEYERTHSKEVGYNLRDLSVLAGGVLRTDAAGNYGTVGQGIFLQSPKGQATLSHYAFGQLARMIGAPAGYLRSLAPSITADALNYGIQHNAPVGQTASLLVKANGEGPHVRSITSETYSRVWDAQLYDAADRMVFQQGTNRGDKWIAPPTWAGDAAGTWRGDRTSFVIRVDGGSIVNDPSIPNGDGRMYRGLMIRNSEVGAASVLIERVLFQFICGNLNLWGAVIDKRYSRRHVGSHVLRDVVREIAQTAREWSQRSAAQDENIIAGLIDHELAASRDAVVDELKKIGYTQEQAISAIATCEQEFHASPRSYWGIAQGTTKLSQRSDWQDDRLMLDQLAAKVLQRGAMLVAA